MRIFVCTIIIFLFSNCKDVRFIRKKVGNQDINITWYYYSYITNVSPDFVEVEKNGHRKEIFKASNVILNTSIQNDSIFLKVFEPSKGLVFTKGIEKEIYGYHIVLDSTGVIDELRLIPDGIREYDW